MQTTPLSKTFEHTLTPELAAEIAAEQKAEEDETTDEETPDEEVEAEATEDGESVKEGKPTRSSNWGLKALLVVFLTIVTFVCFGDMLVPAFGLPGWPIILGICSIPWIVIALLT